EKIVVNLLSNAFKFTEQGGSVEVVIDIPPGPPSKGGVGAVSPFEGGLRGMFEITVRDSGIGIPAERLPHIFDRFYQVDDTHTREQEGSGIGLALTKELVDLHHGEIFVESGLGEGTTFSV
ncbi:MAG: histidine kinase, partial [Calditrichaeota bacterium]|nr:histidine kinase [Calditrichota bacterium]